MLTFATYGSWLHGDERGSWRRHGTEVVPNSGLRTHERSLMSQAETRISNEMRTSIELAIVEVCARRDWPLLALNVRIQHVHVVVALIDADPGRAITAFKAFSTRRMREDRVIGETEKVWARGGSKRYLRDEDSVKAAVDYVCNRQGGRLAGSVYEH